MKKAMVLAMVMAAGVALADTMSLAEARGKIGEAINDPAKMTEVMKSLSAADQKAFVAEVNEAISKMPGSEDSKRETFVEVNRAAMRGAAKGNLITIFAEVFATVPPDALTEVNEDFANRLFKRTGTESKALTDEQFTEVALKVMDKVNERMATVEDGAARSCFAALVFINASSDHPIANLTETLVATMPAAAQNVALTEWIPAAIGDNQQKTYEPLLGASSFDATMNVGDTAVRDSAVEEKKEDVKEEETVEETKTETTETTKTTEATTEAAESAEPVENVVLIKLAGPQLLESMLGEVVEGTPTINTSFNPDNYMSAPVRDEEPKNPEPGPYDGQSIGW